jgi:hypothetical protein
MKISETMCGAFPSSLTSEELEAVHGGSKDNCVDADGVVPEYDASLPGDVLGYADTISESPCERVIYFDHAKMKKLGAGPNDWRRLKAHERAHTRGLDHGAGTGRTNPAFHDSVTIYGR